MREICRRHGLDASTLDFAPPGSNVLFQVEPNRLIKLFPPFWAQDCARENLALSALAGQFDFEVPRVHFSGELEGWPYLVLSRLSGVSLDTIWDGLDPDDRERIAVGLGRMMARLHSTPTAGLSALGPDWTDFIQAQLHYLYRSPARGGSLARLAGRYHRFLRRPAGTGRARLPACLDQRRPQPGAHFLPRNHGGLGCHRRD